MIIECVSAEADVIPPLIIYKGKQHQQSWYEDIAPTKAFFAISENRWTDIQIALNWLHKDFDPYTNQVLGSLPAGCPRTLLGRSLARLITRAPT